MRTVLRYVDLITNAYSQKPNLWLNVYASYRCLDTKANVLSIVSFLWHDVSFVSSIRYNNGSYRGKITHRQNRSVLTTAYQVFLVNRMP